MAAANDPVRPQGSETEVLAAGRRVRISNPDKVFFGRAGLTKLDLVRYYLSIEAPLMSAMGGRPVLLQRHPDGASGKSFFQKRVPPAIPSGSAPRSCRHLRGRPPTRWSSATSRMSSGRSTWGASGSTSGRPGQPTPCMPTNCVWTWTRCRGGFRPGSQTAHLVRDLLAEVGVRSWVKTSGSKGLHVYVPLEARWGAVTVRSAAVAVARELARRHPELVTDAWWKEERGRRVFVDFNQNAPHKTVFGAWSVRPRVGAQVSTPLAWEDLDATDPDSLTAVTVPGRIGELGDPWADRWEDRQGLEALLEWHERDMAAGLMDAPWPPQYPKMPNEPPRVAPSRARRR
ncbi:MAG: ATP-dependent DNA ligase [Microthrixaceae bacterium]